MPARQTRAGKLFDIKISHLLDRDTSPRRKAAAGGPGDGGVFPEPPVNCLQRCPRRGQSGAGLASALGSSWPPVSCRASSSVAFKPTSDINCAYSGQLTPWSIRVVRDLPRAASFRRMLSAAGRPHDLRRRTPPFPLRQRRRTPAPSASGALMTITFASRRHACPSRWPSRTSLRRWRGPSPTAARRSRSSCAAATVRPTPAVRTTQPRSWRPTPVVESNTHAG